LGRVEMNKERTKLTEDMIKDLNEKLDEIVEIKMRSERDTLFF